MLRPVGKLHAGAGRFAAFAVNPGNYQRTGWHTALPTTKQPVMTLFSAVHNQNSCYAGRRQRDAVEKWICIAIYYNIDR
jgi:hypothetical protein